MNRYNEAIQLLQQQQFLQAEALLKAMLHEGQSSDEVNWALGLTQVYLGQPQQALSYWARITNAVAFQLDVKKELIEHSLDAYKTLYASYNEALTHIKQKQYSEAWEILEQLMTFPDAKPLALYEAYINTAYYLQKQQAVQQVLQNAPKHILSAPSIHKARITQTYVEQQLENKKEIRLLQQTVQQTKNTRNWFGVGMGALATAVLATFLIMQPNDVGIQTANEAPPETNDEQLIQQQNDVARQLQTQVGELEAQVQQLTSKVDSYNQKEQLLAQSNIVFDDVVEQAQMTQYQRGYNYYRNGQYELAKQSLENSRLYETNVYYTDDALYYLIRTKKQLGEPVEEHYEQFIDSELAFIQQSPYYDDVLLQYAEHEVEQKNTEQAQQLLQRLTDEFGQEWTGQRAKTLLKELAGV